MEETEESPLLRRSSENDDQEEDQVVTISRKKKVIAGFCALTASATFCINNLIIQDKNLHCTDLLFMRSILQMIIFAFWLKIRQIQWWPKSRMYSTRREYILDIIFAIIQVISSETVLTMTWLSLSLLPIGNAMAFIYSSPISVIILSYVILKHRIGLYRSLIAVVTIAGAILVAIFSHDSSLSSMSGTGIMVALIVAFFVGLQTVTTFTLRRFHPAALMLNSGILGLLVSLIACSLDKKSLIFHDTANANYAYLFLSACLGILGLLLCIYSSQILVPMLFTVLRCQELVFSFIAQTVLVAKVKHSGAYHFMCLVLDNCPPPTSPLVILGTIFILLGSLLQGFEGYLVSKVSNSFLHKLLFELF